MNHQYRILNPGYGDSDQRFSRGEGNYLFSENGEKYIDMVMGAGSLVFGHADPQITAQTAQQMANSSLYLQNNHCVHDLIGLIDGKLPYQLANYMFCNTGSEATQRAIRLARAATGKMHVASFQGGWHGMNEWTLLDDGGRFGQCPITSYSGIPEVALSYSMLLPYNDVAAFSELEKHADKLAAIIIEPLQGSNPQPDIQGYLHQLVALCKKLGILVIFDEIITGFRIAPGGASEEFNLTPDIVTYGKIIGGGLPLGLVVCSNEIYDATFADPQKSILTGGTFSANPLSAAAGFATLSKLDQRCYEHLDDLSDFFRNTLNDMFETRSLPFRAGGYKSINRVYFTDKPFDNRTQRDALELPTEAQAHFRQLLWQEHIIWPTNGIVCLPVTQDKETLSEVFTHLVNAAEKVVTTL